MNLTKEARRDQVVEGCLKIIGKHGMAGLTTSALAKEVGMSEANLYRHFKNKQEILLETVTQIGERLRQNLNTVMKPCSSPADRLRQIFQLHLRYVGQNKGIPRLVFSDEIHAGNPELKLLLLETISFYTESLEEVVRAGKKDGSLKQSIDPKATALTMIGIIQVSILRWALSGFTLSIEEEGLKLWNNLEACIKR